MKIFNKEFQTANTRDIKMKQEFETSLVKIEFNDNRLLYNNTRNDAIQLTSKINNSIILEQKRKKEFLDTQKMIHDLRKPIAQFKMFAQMLLTTEDIKERDELTMECLPDLLRSANAAEALIAEVLPGAIDHTLKTESVDPQELIEFSLNETFRTLPNAEVSFDYEFSHTHSIQVNTLKVLRVFSNIVNNAVEAMNKKGSMIFRTQDLLQEGKEFVEFSIKNYGSHIPKQDLEKVFQDFYTKDKIGGTGLGLAIAQEIVQDYKGKISCFSDRTENCPEGFVEFRFTLPVSQTEKIQQENKAESIDSAIKDYDLPRSSHDICSIGTIIH